MSGEVLEFQNAVFILQLMIFPVLISCRAEFLRQWSDVSLSPFPSNFLFGTASSAYQFEGGYLDDGKGLNNWDVFTHTNPGKINNQDNGDVAADHYHRYMEDINLMASIGVNSYRFSISWARILPKGRFGDINFRGIDHYNKLIDALLLNGIQPFVTLTHLDFPQEMEDRYWSWLSPESQRDFAYYAEICFKYFGDRVKYWVTFNEPNFQANLGYKDGSYPPSRCTPPFGNCTVGNSETEPFIVAHNIILSHARAVNIYRTKYKKQQGGMIGIVLHTIWFEPLTNTEADRLAAERAQSFFMNWFLDPIMFGRYPAEMETILGSNLPQFSSNEGSMLKNGLDFIGINHYTSQYVQDCLLSACEPGTGVSRIEGYARLTHTKNGVSLGNATDLDWLYVYPSGMRKVVNYLKERYNNIPMFITENGYGDDEGTTNSSLEELIQDAKRVEYLDSYLDSLMKSMREGADVRGYFVWSVLDGFEWLSGYTVRFGLNYVDYKTLTRTPKLSASWYSNFIATHKTSSF